MLNTRPKWRARPSENVGRSTLQQARVRPPSYRTPGDNAPSLFARERIVRALYKAHLPLVLAGAVKSGAGAASSGGRFLAVRRGPGRPEIWLASCPGSATAGLYGGRELTACKARWQGPSARFAVAPVGGWLRRALVLTRVLELFLLPSRTNCKSSVLCTNKKGGLLLRRTSTECALPPGNPPNFPLLFPLVLISQSALSSCIRSRARISSCN